MSDIRRVREEGVCLVDSVHNKWLLKPSEYENVRAATLKGARFVDTVGFYGQRIALRLTEVESVALLTRESIAAELADTRADRQDDELAGSAA